MIVKREKGLVRSAHIVLCLPQLGGTAEGRPDRQRKEQRTGTGGRAERAAAVSCALRRWRWQPAACTPTPKWIAWTAMAWLAETEEIRLNSPCRCHFPGSGPLKWRETTSTDCATESFYWRIKSDCARWLWLRLCSGSCSWSSTLSCGPSCMNR